MTLIDEHMAKRGSAVSGEDCAARDAAVVPISWDIKRRGQTAAVVAAANAAAVDTEARFPGEAFAADQGAAAARHSRPAGTRRRRRQHLRRRRCLLRARPRLRLDRHDLCDAPDHGRLPRPPCAQQRVAPRLAAPDRAPSNCCSPPRPPKARAAAICARASARSSAGRPASASTKSATVISYGAQADGIVTTARRTPGLASTDQVLVALAEGRLSARRTSSIGTRSACAAHAAPGFMLQAGGTTEQILADPYHKIHAQTVMPVAHLMWSAVWAGIAASAVERARAFVRKRRRAKSAASCRPARRTSRAPVASLRPAAG